MFQTRVSDRSMAVTILSHAFDCLPHRLLIPKMAAYGVSNNACTLIVNYLCGRQQRVKLCDTHSDWMTILKGAPQGSIFGPFGYNVFSNDLLFYMNEYCTIYNYADDNTCNLMYRWKY